MTSAPRIGYAAMLERFAPTEAVELSAHAESRGFDGVLATDHLQPWLPRHGEAGHVWSVLGALGARTSGELATGAVTAGYRTHPAVVAQASATIAALYPGRHWLGIGAGEAINEHVAGGYWPEAPERIVRMFEAIDIIRKLFGSAATGRTVKHGGASVQLETSRLWATLDAAPPIVVATAGPLTARRAGRSADGILTIGQAPDKAAQLLDRFAEGARESSGDPRARVRAVRVDLSWAPDDEAAMRNALAEWPLGGLRYPRGDIRSPIEMEQLVRMVRPDDFDGRMLVSSDPDAHRAHIQRYLDLGFDRVYLHNAGRDQRAWLDVFGREVLPGLRR